MRVHLHGDEAAGEFASQLLGIGDGKYPIDTSPDIIQLPKSIGTFVCNIDELMSKVYPICFQTLGIWPGFLKDAS